MNILETKEKLTLNELLRIAYTYGNDNSEMPERNGETIDKEFNEWVDNSKQLFEKLNLPAVNHCALRQIETVMIEASKCEAKFQMKYVDFDSFTVPSKITENRIDNILGDRSIETIRIDIEHCG